MSPVASAQIKSSLLFAALYADGPHDDLEPDSRGTTPNACLPISGSRFQQEGCTVRSKGAPLSAGPEVGWWCLGIFRPRHFPGRGFDCAGFRCDDSWVGMNRPEPDWWRSFNRWVHIEVLQSS